MFTEKVANIFLFMTTHLTFSTVTLCYVGIQDRSKVKDSQLTGSSMHYARSGDHHAAKHGRLFSTTGAGGWLAENNGNWFMYWKSV